MLAYKASCGLLCIACHFKTAGLCFLETDGGENENRFLQGKSPEKAVICVMMLVQSRKSGTFQTWEEGHGDIGAFVYTVASTPLISSQCL